MANQYEQVDEYLNQYNGKEAYESIKKMISDSEDKNVGLQYRLAHSCYILSNFCLSKEDNRNRLLEEAYEACKVAYELEPENSDVLKWSAIITGTLAESESLKSDQRIKYLKEFKNFLDEAFKRSPDSSVYHMNGRFLYRMATLTEEEKDHVNSAFGSIPTASIEEALVQLHKAEELTPGHTDNLMCLAKCYIAKGDLTEAQKYLIPVIELSTIDELDEFQMAEAKQLLAITTESPEQKDDHNEPDILALDTESDESEDTNLDFTTDTEEF